MMTAVTEANNQTWDLPNTKQNY